MSTLSSQIDGKAAAISASVARSHWFAGSRSVHTVVHVDEGGIPCPIPDVPRAALEFGRMAKRSIDGQGVRYITSLAAAAARTLRMREVV